MGQKIGRLPSESSFPQIHPPSQVHHAGLGDLDTHNSLPHLQNYEFIFNLFLLGYTGTYCEIDVDDCESNPCVNDGICMDTVNGFTCTCQPGKTLLSDIISISCVYFFSW